MSNFFEKALKDVDSLEEEILGPDYPYYKFINSPKELGMSKDGNKIGHNIGEMISYTELLLTGRGNASKTGGPLGNKFFLKTGAKCQDVKTKNNVTRSLYINNVPSGNIPFLSSITGADFTEFEGLIPGIFSDLGNLNPMGIFGAFMIGENPPCREITMETIDSNNRKLNKTAYVLDSDIRNLDPCWFPDKKNPITNENCREAFGLIQNNTNENYSNTTINKLYIGSLSIIVLYIFLKMYLKK